MLHHLTILQALAKIKQKEISVSDIYTDVEREISALNKKLNVYLSQDNKAATSAMAVTNTPLAGLPIAVKDNFCTTDLPTTASASILENYISPYESTVTTKLKKAGGVIIGKTNMDAWAHGSSTETSQFGKTLNPRNLDHLPGGSSGGSAAAVAADLCIAAIGSETAGSIRQPAAWCGAVGLKPTYGRVSRYGVVAMASSTDSPGVITKTVADAAFLLPLIAGHDPYDGTSTSQPLPDLTDALTKGVKSLKIGMLYLDLPGLEGIRPHFENVMRVFTDAGAQVELVDALDPHFAISTYTVVQRAEVSSNLARFDGVRYGKGRDNFGDEAKRRIMLGTYTLSKGYADQYYAQAQKVRTLFRQDYERLFSEYDVLISATSPSFAKKSGASENAAMFGELEDMLLEPSSITGLPGISVPCFHDPETNLYLGVNIMAPMWREDLVVQTAQAYEQATSWNSWNKS